ncbi:MAG: hypothetical protein ACI86C_000463 [Candidatus Latescibacterota bacterium]|jgi:hypothetical protein
MTNAKLKNGKNSKLRSFFLFLLLATLFWFLVKFSKEYTSTVSAKLNYTNMPANTLLANGNNEEVSFDLFANGFEFLFFKLKMPTVDVPVSKYYEKGQHTIRINSEDFSRLVLEELNNNNDLHNLSIEALLIKLNSIINKKVPVRPRVDVSFKEGFKQLNEFITTPDSITVSGPAVALDMLLYIETVPVIVEAAEKHINLTLAIEKPINPEVQYTPKSVSASMEVGEFTQKRLQVQVRLKNVPSDVRIKLIPEKIIIVFNVSLEDFKTITAENFILECDYSDRNRTENFMVPKLTKQPDFVHDIELETKKVDYLIFK